MGKTAAGTSPEGNPHWSDSTGKERVLEVMGRMEGPTPLLETLMLQE